MSMKPLVRMAAGAAGLACAGAMLAAPANAQTAGQNSATALSGSGPIAIPTISAVKFAGKTADKSLLELPANDLISAKVLHSTAKAASARAAVADVVAKKLGLSAHAVVAGCKHGMGHVDLVSAELNGKKLAVSPAPNSRIGVTVPKVGGVTVTLNKQVKGAGGALTVTAIEAVVTLAGQTEAVDISQAMCAPGHHPGHPKPGPGEPSNPGRPSAQPTQSASASQPPNGQAPAPTPVHQDLPVTG